MLWVSWTQLVQPRLGREVEEGARAVCRAEPVRDVAAQVEFESEF